MKKAIKNYSQTVWKLEPSKLYEHPNGTTYELTSVSAEWFPDDGDGRGEPYVEYNVRGFKLFKSGNRHGELKTYISTPGVNLTEEVMAEYGIESTFGGHVDPHYSVGRSLEL